MFRRHRNSLDMYGDGDEVDLLIDVEETFGVAIEARGAETLGTVGDLYDVVVGRLDPEPNAPCLSARAFRQLAPELHAGGARVRPSTRLASLAGGNQRVADWLRELQFRTALDVDARSPGALAVWVGLLCFIVPIAAIALTWDYAGYLALAWPLLWAFTGLFYDWTAEHTTRCVPDNIRTVGDLIRRMMPKNYRRLTADGATGNRADIWLTIVALCRDHSGYRGQVDRETTFIA